MHDADGISSHRRVKNSTLLRSRVEFQIKSFCFFHCLLDRGHFTPTMALDVFFGIVIISYVLTVIQCLFVSTLCRGIDVAFFQRTLVEFVRVPQIITHLHRDLLPGFEA